MQVLSLQLKLWFFNVTFLKFSALNFRLGAWKKRRNFYFYFSSWDLIMKGKTWGVCVSKSVSKNKTPESLREFSLIKFYHKNFLIYNYIRIIKEKFKFSEVFYKKSGGFSVKAKILNGKSGGGKDSLSNFCSFQLRQRSTPKNFFNEISELIISSSSYLLSDKQEHQSSFNGLAS